MASGAEGTQIGEVIWSVAGRRFVLGPAPRYRPLLMGIINVTPDSFFDGGVNLRPDDAVANALRLVEEGAEIIDVGGESTRPGAEPVPVQTELGRVVPVIERLRACSDVLISVDTSKAAVARRALAAGAQIINDVTALRGDPGMIELAVSSDAGLIIMHMRGTPKTMQQDPHYRDVVDEVRRFLAERLSWLVGRGVAVERVAVDPGIGFGKRLGHNLALVGALGRLGELGRPVCFGGSRKSFIGQVTGRPAGQRLHGSVAATLVAYQHGAHLLRVHDVGPLKDAVTMYRAIEGAGADGRF